MDDGINTTVIIVISVTLIFIWTQKYDVQEIATTGERVTPPLPLQGRRKREIGSDGSVENEARHDAEIVLPTF